MASRLLARTSRMTAYMPNLRAAVKHFRAFATYESQPAIFIDDPETTLDSPLGPFGPQDKRFPLPGLVGTYSQIQNIPEMSITYKREKGNPQMLFDTHLPEERQRKVIDQVANVIQMEEEQYLEEMSARPEDLLEFVAQDCPIILKKDFADLFPSRNLTQESLTVVTISQKTENDMSGWNMEVEKEREMLLEAFVQGATDICESLEATGFWADFIEPSCGKPYLGDHTNSTMFETDERYRKLGFEIEDLGCCKVISHHLWGTHAYVGCLFTNAPLSHPSLKFMTKKDQ